MSAAVFYRTFGCRANQYDTELMRQELEARGLATTESRDEAVLCVVNTCTVTARADADARRFIRRLRRENPDVRIVVTGCSASRDPRRFQSLPGVSRVVEGHDPVAVAEAVQTVSPLARLTAPLRGLHREPVGGELLARRAGATRGWLKIQDGCDWNCSFCATRLARGRSRSRPPGEIVAEARLLAASHPELVLTGVHIGHYGRDLEPPTSLSRLVARLLEEVPSVRFRLGSIEATEVDALLLDLLATSEGRLAPHLHMPLQSGADPVLRRMRRWYTRETYRARALEIASRLGPPLGLGADVITGFPGEGGEDHERTLALVVELPFTYLHVFPFSPRPGTPAAELGEPVPQRIAGDRSRELRELALKKGRAYRRERIGATCEVVLEGAGGRALTGDYLRVRVEGPVPSPGVLHRGRLRGDPDDPYIDLSHAEEGIGAR